MENMFNKTPKAHRVNVKSSVSGPIPKNSLLQIASVAFDDFHPSGSILCLVDITLV